ALLWVERADAATAAVFRGPGDARALREASFRLQGELAAVGLEVVNLERPVVGKTDSPEGRAWIERTSTERGIDAFIDVIGDSAPVAVDVWICERSPRHLRV